MNNTCLSPSAGEQGSRINEQLTMSKGIEPVVVDWEKEISEGFVRFLEMQVLAETDEKERALTVLVLALAELARRNDL
jgi:hypothetical protein